MKFAKTVFWVAAIWGFLVLTPLYFMFDLIGAKDPPPIQLAFLIIATNPARFRPIIPAVVIEKFSYGIALIVLYSQGRLHASDLTFAGTDLLLGILFVVAFVKLKSEPGA